MSRTGWLDVLTARAARCIPNSGHVRNSPTGVCSMFIRRFLICSTKRRIGTLPLSRMSMHVSNPIIMCMIILEMNHKSLLDSGLFSICKWKLTWHQIWSPCGCCWQAGTRRSIAKREPMALVQPESKITYVGWEPRSTYSHRSACWAPWS